MQSGVGWVYNYLPPVCRVVGFVISKLLDRCDFKPCNGPCYFLY